MGSRLYPHCGVEVRISVPRLTRKPYWANDPPGSKCHGREDPNRSAPPMTRRLTRLADLAYRRRGRMVLAWIAAAVVIIGVGSALAGEFQADYDTPGSESKAASDLTEKRFGG